MPYTEYKAAVFKQSHIHGAFHTVHFEISFTLSIKGSISIKGSNI